MKGNLIEYSKNSWSNNQWLKYVLWLRTHDDQNYTIGHSVKYYDNDGINIVRGDSIHYYSKIHVNVKESKLQQNPIVFPNPSNGKILLSYPNNITSVEVYYFSPLENQT